MLDINHAVLMLGWTILALSLSSDHLDLLGQLGVDHSGSQCHLQLPRARGGSVHIFNM